MDRRQTKRTEDTYAVDEVTMAVEDSRSISLIEIEST
jgi:hypothetical protein